MNYLFFSLWDLFHLTVVFFVSATAVKNELKENPIITRDCSVETTVAKKNVSQIAMIMMMMR